ncbi:HAD family hydrolase [Nocardia puris]|uniref:Putative hydrolase of the HAD superfamily n=1 Tax=Nocardia puris TaxID=208602 RepID=A0A366DQC5_9NOCA|nr:HAD family hydrolase [Nocardia puris]RBO91428.1 putative hydrolase of the HAD superfamily [Nocardia puris]
MAVRGVLFDVDDTLFAFSNSEESGLFAHLRAERLLDRFTDPAAALRIWRELTDTHFDRFVRGELTFTEQQRVRTRAFLDGLGIALAEAEIAEWFRRYDTHRRAAWAAFPDTEPALRRLAPAYRLGVVSNSSAEAQRRKLGIVGLLPYFGDALVCSDQHGVAKPDAAIFRAGCDSLGLEPREVASVGDKYAVDAVGARDAGLVAYWLDRGNARGGNVIDEGIRVIGSLEELPDVLVR